MSRTPRTPTPVDKRLNNQANSLNEVIDSIAKLTRQVNILVDKVKVLEEKADK